MNPLRAWLAGLLTAAALAGMLAACRGEDDEAPPSADGRYWGPTGPNEDGETAAFLVYD